MNKFKRLLSILFLCPLLPIVGIPIDVNDNGENGDGEGSDGENIENANNENNVENNNNNESNNEKAGKTFSSDEVESKIKARLDRERKKIEKQVRGEYEEKKKRESMTELEKIKADLEAEKKANEDRVYKSKQRLIKAEVTTIGTELNIVDIDAVLKLMDLDGIDVNDNDDVEGVRESLEALIKSKPYLVKTNSNTNSNTKLGDDQNTNNKPKENSTMNQLIRGYFKRS